MKKILLFISIFLFFNSTNAMVQDPRSCEKTIALINERVIFDMLMENGLNMYFDVKLVFNKTIHKIFAEFLNDIDTQPAWFDNNHDLARNFLYDLIKKSILILNLKTDSIDPCSDFTYFQKKVIAYILESMRNDKIEKILNSLIYGKYKEMRIEHHMLIFEYFALFVKLKNGRQRVRF